MAGHADSDITLKIYTHYCKDIDNSKQTLEKIFGKIAYIEIKQIKIKMVGTN